MYSSSSEVEFEYDTYSVGNATLDTVTNWDCVDCVGISGITLKKLTVGVYNVTNPDLIAGFPSVAVFVSQDLSNWYNYFSTVPSDPDKKNDISKIYIANWYETKITINSTYGSCLGGIYNAYFVTCLNLRNIASTTKLREIVKGPTY